MAVDDIAEGASLLIKAAASFHADGLGGSDLNVVDVAPIPDRLEDAVAEAESQDVLDGLLAQIMIDTVNLFLGEHLMDGIVESLCACEIMAEARFHHQTPPSVVMVEP